MEKYNHGHLEEVGYDTYIRLLDEVLKEEKGIKIEEDIECQIDLNVTSYIPDEYIRDSNQKIEIYQDISLCKTEKDIIEVLDEIIDRFGNPPEEIEKLFEITRIRQMAKKKNIIKISSKQDAIVFQFNKFDNDNISALIKKYGVRIKFSNGIKPMITLKINKNIEKEIIKETKEFVSNL